MSLSLFPRCAARVAFLLAAAQCAVLPALAADAAKPQGKPPTAAAIAARKADAAHYTACMSRIDKSAKDAFDDADAWVALGGGEPAKHCAAAALLKLGFPTEAAERLETLAHSSHQDEATRAAMWTQAAEAWSEAKDLARAHAAQSAAIQLAPGAAEMWTGRARIRAMAQNYGLAVDDLNEALKRKPNDAEALVMRASAYRYLDALDLSLQDLDAAIKAAPGNPQAYLERGIVYRLQKRPNQARADWAAALRILPEDSPLVEEVRRNIELLEFPAPEEAEKPAAAKP